MYNYRNLYISRCYKHGVQLVCSLTTDPYYGLRQWEGDEAEVRSFLNCYNRECVQEYITNDNEITQSNTLQKCKHLKKYAAKTGHDS